MIHNIPRNLLQPIIALDDFDLFGESPLQLRLLRLVQIFVLQNLVELRAQSLVLDQHFRYALLVKQRHRRAIVRGLLEVVFRNVTAEPCISLALAPQQRRAGECQILRPGQTLAHVLRQRFVLRAVRLVHNHDDIVAWRKLGILPPLVPAEFLDQGEHQPFVLPEEFAHLLAILGLRGFGLGDCASVQKIAVYLPVQIIAVSHYNKGEVAGLLAEYCARVKDHRETLARSLRVPEHAELAMKFLAPEKGFISPVHADELVVLSDDLLAVPVVENEILYIIQQPALRQQAFDHAFQADALLTDRGAVDFLLLVICAQPVKEMLPLRRDAAHLGLDGVGQHAKCVGQEKLRNLLLVSRQVVIKSVA